MKNKRNALFNLLADALIVNMSIVLAYLLRFDGNPTKIYFDEYLRMIPLVTIINLFMFYICGSYHVIWKHSSLSELKKVLAPILLANSTIIVMIYIFKFDVPRSIYLIATLAEILGISVFRLKHRVIRYLKRVLNIGQAEIQGKRTLIVGAGEAATFIIAESRGKNRANVNPICAVDDNTEKIGKRICGIPVLGKMEEIKEICEARNIEEILIAIPSLHGEEFRKIMDYCRDTNLRTKIVPSVSELGDARNGNVNDNMVNGIRDVKINDLLGRPEIKLDTTEIEKYIKKKRVFVTGGGGSIGTEICRQIQKYDPEEIVILELSELHLYNILEEFRSKFSHANIVGRIANIQDKEELRNLFKEFKPNIVFHTAAYKHVHFMEDSYRDSVKNNAFGTLNLCELADEFNVERFILISTDKAVNSTNIYGATKRICELLVQGYNEKSKTEFVAVRFGNVLGSNGSIIPLFKKQIQEGGPVTVTHKEVIRYFMTIPEAVRLVLQAGSMGKGGEIFILDMGEQVKIDTLARDLIKLSGFEPDKDIKIDYVGLRPGEKLFEELLMSEEGLSSTHHEKIKIAQPMEVDLKKLKKDMDELLRLNKYDFVVKLKEVVPTYKNEETLKKLESQRKITKESKKIYKIN